MSSGQLSAIVLVIDTEIPAVHKDVLDSFPVCRYHLIIAYLSTTIEIVHQGQVCNVLLVNLHCFIASRVQSKELIFRLVVLLLLLSFFTFCWI